jgi:hypothetical protein
MNDLEIFLKKEKTKGIKKLAFWVVALAVILYVVSLSMFCLFEAASKTLF